MNLAHFPYEEDCLEMERRRIPMYMSVSRRPEPSESVIEPVEMLKGEEIQCLRIADYSALWGAAILLTLAICLFGAAMGWW